MFPTEFWTWIGAIGMVPLLLILTRHAELPPRPQVTRRELAKALLLLRKMRAARAARRSRASWMTDVSIGLYLVAYFLLRKALQEWAPELTPSFSLLALAILVALAGPRLHPRLAPLGTGTHRVFMVLIFLASAATVTLLAAHFAD
jgi:hypothetical protein